MLRKTKHLILPFYKTKEGYCCPVCGTAYKGLPPPGCNQCWYVRKVGVFIEERNNSNENVH